MVSGLVPGLVSGLVSGLVTGLATGWVTGWVTGLAQGIGMPMNVEVGGNTSLVRGCVGCEKPCYKPGRSEISKSL